MDKVNMCQIQKQIDNSKEEMMGVISFILAIFPLSFVINSYLVAMKNIGENQGTENIRTIFFYVLIFLIIGLMFIIMYILTSAIKIKAHRYSLLFILGIKKKDFWKILYKDYCITLLLIGVKSTIVVNLICLCMTSAIWSRKKKIFLIDFLKNYFISGSAVCVILVLLILVSVIIVFYHSLKRNMLEFWEGLNENISYNYDTKVFYYLKPILGVCIECVAIIFCLNYHTIYYAAVLQLISFYLISSSTECLRWIVKCKSKRDYKKIITSNAVLYQYKLNSKLIISIYLLNFIVIFVLGGVILSNLSYEIESNYQERYPYEFVVYGKGTNFLKESYPFFQGKTEEGKSIAIFSLSSYEDMVKKKETLSNEEVIYISQNNSEDFKPLEGKKEIKIYFNSEEADYKVKDSRWEIIFGENVSSKLENILVISDYEFKINAIDKWSLWYGDRNNIKIKKGVYVWKRTEAIEIEQKNDQYVLILVCIIGIFLILEGQGIILIKQVVNHSSITNKYKLFFSLGMSQKDRKKYFFHEIKNIAFYPMILGCVRGILLLGIIYFYQEGEFSKIFIYYLAVCVLILLIQYGSYYCITMLMAKLYKIDSEPQ
mgnify:FL=1|nr:hypothetical protein [uncultured Mediterraneibacter sp.]